jgi:hypothetical protein
MFLMTPILASALALCFSCSWFPSNSGHLPLVLRTYDAFGVSAGEMRQARVTVDDLLRPASVHAEWRECSAARFSQRAGEPPCGDLAVDELVLRIVAATSATVPSSLGSALLDARGGVLATVYADRVRSLAARARVNPGQLLGRVIAHEIGHLLLSGAPHAASGLMRPRWSESEMRNERWLDWRWSSREIMDIARAVESRTVPVTTTVSTCRIGAKCPRR